MPTVQIEEEELRELLNDRDHLRRQVADLQAAGTALVELRREGDPTYCVSAFHGLFGYPVRTTPSASIPAFEIKLRARLMTEEYFETMEGLLGNSWVVTRDRIYAAIGEITPEPDLVKIADGLCDVDYINEGTRLYFGIPRVPILKEVQRANMEKVGGGFRADGKILKPLGWRAPDIAGVLRAHGWAA